MDGPACAGRAVTETNLMTANRWHIDRTATALTLSRRARVRWDVAVEACFPPARKGRLAHQIRQDMWRKLQSLRGFSPAVRVVEDGPHLRIVAGGDISARSFPRSRVEAQISELLTDPEKKERWLANARLEPSHA